MLEVETKFKELIELLCSIIQQRRIIQFYYESARRNEERTIRPYHVLPRGKNIELVGLSIEELSKPLQARQPGHYNLSQLLLRIENKQFKILAETFDDPEVPRNIVDSSKSKVICRFIYDGEDEKEIRKQWIKIKYI